MPLHLSVTLIGANELRKVLQAGQKFTSDARMMEAWERAVEIVANDVRRLAPHWEGNLRASFEEEVIVGEDVIEGLVYSDLPYAAFQERGVSAYWPAYDGGLADWAEDHGWDPWVLAVLISENGIIAKKYAEEAVLANQAQIFELVGAVAVAILAGDYGIETTAQGAYGNTLPPG